MAGEYWRGDKCPPGNGGEIAPASYADATGRSRVPGGATYDEQASTLEPRHTNEGDGIPRPLDGGVREELIRQIDMRVNRCGDYVAFAASSTKLGACRGLRSCCSGTGAEGDGLGAGSGRSHPLKFRAVERR